MRGEKLRLRLLTLGRLVSEDWQYHLVLLISEGAKCVYRLPHAFP